MATIRLGSFDSGQMPQDLKTFFKPYHTYGEMFERTHKFRSDDNNKFVEWDELEETTENVIRLQTFLHEAGFMTRRFNPGICDYVTEAAIRLFQEYVRTILKKPCTRDGIVGKNTWGMINNWPPDLKADWHPDVASSHPSPEYKKWMELLKRAKEFYSITENQGPIMKAVNSTRDTKSTLKIENWDFNPDRIHLIGIRRNEYRSANRRKNDDLFVLLINGMVFKFWGSTDPSDHMTKLDEPFLVEGQHKYRFGWHGLGKVDSEKRDRRGEYTTYRALRPAIGDQVVVVRDWKNDGGLTADDLRANNGVGLATAINIHWTGNSHDNATWSAGCQVIKGNSYINHKNEVVDCSSFAANSYDDLFQNRKKNKGAYQFLADLVVCNVPPPKPDKPSVNYLLYTLGNELESLADNVFGANYVKDALTRLGADNV